MLDRKLIRNDPEKVREGIRNKGSDFDLDHFLEVDSRRRELLQEVESLKHRKNVASREISQLMREGKDASELIEEMKETSSTIKEYEDQLKDIEEELIALELTIPNIPHQSAPPGTCDKDNPVVREWGDPFRNDLPILPHWEIGEKLGVLDLEAGAAVSGSGFVVLRGDGALLSRALVNYMLDTHRSRGHEEVAVPYLVSRDSMIGTGQLPKMADDMYHCGRDDLFCIPTAEVPVTNLLRESTVSGSDLPVRMVAYSPCFRREAGSYGKDTRGLIRVHQFDKVEMVRVVRPEESYQQLELLLQDALYILEQLDIPYRVIELCTGDLSFSAAKCYDIETYAPATGKWLEVSSCSNFEDFQARRARIKYREDKDGSSRFVHTLNGSGLALPRIIATILELFQTPTGKVRVPPPLAGYMGGREFLGG
ncbi:MAG: serine--tRNA ligase [Candidatus Latescibacteria bacterium]|nr:serine--tRNA ligase [bacterium]MBD3425052.1 serine--tRNA ligase [Candidatus Latescibacterota bacterium]